MKVIHCLSLCAASACCSLAGAAAAAPLVQQVGPAAIDSPATRTSSGPLTSLAAAESAADPSVPMATADLRVEQGRVVSGQFVLRVKQGDRVVLRVTSDKADELHLHGYDLHRALTPGKTAVLDFKAVRTGRFTYELHHQEVELGAVEVYPR